MKLRMSVILAATIGLTIQVAHRTEAHAEDLATKEGFFYKKFNNFFKEEQKPRSAWEEQVRAGCPRRIAPWAQCSHEKYDDGYYVGGGAAFKGEPAYTNEGTFGVDYAPPWSRVRLNWWHGARYQGGAGQYETDRHNNPFHQKYGPRGRE